MKGGLAASWNLTLFSAVGAAIGLEVRTAYRQRGARVTVRVEATAQAAAAHAQICVLA